MSSPFSPVGLGKSIFDERYALYPGESYESACERLASNVGSNESEKVQEDFNSILRDGLFMPGGRIWYGAGRARSQMLNCFVVPTDDSREGWGQTISDMLVTSGMGGGVGINCSPIRPRGTAINGIGGQATGSVSLMRMVNYVGDELVGGGGRRLALMLCLDFDHPDTQEFIKAKLNKKELNNANVSVVLPKDLSADEFVHAVHSGRALDLRFDSKPTGKRFIARNLWEQIVKNAFDSGEPGVLNGHLANKYNSLSYKYDLVSTNPCGEIWLPGYGCCDLGALVLPNFVREGKMDWDLLDATISVAVRFLDDVLDVNEYPLPAIKEMAQGERRIGLGVMGLHSLLLDLGLAYNSNPALDFVYSLFKRIKNVAYQASVGLAKEKGPFPFYDARFLKSPFVKDLNLSVRKSIAEHGIRNCALLTIAPTGTTSMVHGVTSGIEPMFSPVYIRRRFVVGDTAGEKKTTRTLVVPKDYLDHPHLAQGAYDLTAREHFTMQAIVQKHIDNAVSKTINVPKDADIQELSSTWLEFLPKVKGTTIYREGSRGAEPLQYVKQDEVSELLRNWDGEVDYEGLDSTDCVSGVCEIPTTS